MAALICRHALRSFQLLTITLVLPQVLAKSCKMVPVMLMGTLVGGKRYSVLEYACALLIGGGVSLFAARNSGKVTQKLAAPDARLGYALCLANLLLDGYTNAAQVRAAQRCGNAQPPRPVPHSLQGSTCRQLPSCSHDFASRCRLPPL